MSQSRNIIEMIRHRGNQQVPQIAPVKVMFGEPAALQSPRQPLPEKHILLVEDEATFREILTYFLRGKGYVVDAVGSAGAAITCLESVRYALVISDWLLPDGNGVDVADAAVKRGAKTLIVSGLLFRLPGGAAMRHELLLKHLGPTQVSAAVQRAIGSPMAEAQTSDQATVLPEETPKLPLAI
jgi:DNA-binding NtrC family response regulator